VANVSSPANSFLKIRFFFFVCLNLLVLVTRTRVAEKVWTHELLAAGDLPWLVVLEYDDVAAVPFELVTRTSQLKPGIYFSQTGDFEDVRVHAAKAGFAKVLAQTLQKLATEEKIHIANGCERIHTLVMHFLKISAEKALDVMDAAIREEEEGPLVADEEAIKEAMGNEKVEFDLERKSSAARKSELKAVKEYVLQRRPKPKSLVTVASLYWKAKPKEATWSLSDVRELCPVGAPIWLHRDSRQGRWQMEYKRVGSKSASWGIWDGEDNSVKEIVKFAWIYHQQANPDLECTNENCPVGGLPW